VVILRIIRLNAKLFYAVLKQVIYVGFFFHLGTKGGYFTVHCYLTVTLNQVGECLLRGTD
jgi:hypothetical protein